MRLRYFDGNNFGDALNPMIFDKVLPNFFDTNDEHDFFGIGSIIGFEMMQKAKNKIVFSSGYSPSYAKKYGEMKVNDTFKFYCVRGPLTAGALKLEKKLAVTDGAALLREFNFKSLPKKYKVSYMPHWTSEFVYPWKNICEECDIHYVSPRGSVQHIIEEILQSEIVIAEAMHFAIVADALRVPWIPIKAYDFIDDFKWSDWTESLSIKYEPVQMMPMYTVDTNFGDKLKKKTRNLVPQGAIEAGKKIYSYYQDRILLNKNIKAFCKLKTKDPYLSNDAIFNSKTDHLLDALDEVRKDYSDN